MTGQALQLDAFTTAGSLLKSARLSQGMSEREAADQLKIMPNYVAILERDDYQALRSPAFARGYVKSYGRLLGLEQELLMSVFDQQAEAAPVRSEKPVASRPVQLQRTGLGVIIGLGVLVLVVFALWWWENDAGVKPLPAASLGTNAAFGQQGAQQYTQQYAGGGK